MRRIRAISALLVVLVLGACALFPSYRDTSTRMTSMAVFDPVRYAGQWYEIARFPVPFEAGCRNTVATYALRPDGTLGVRNDCDKATGHSAIEGSATVVGPGRLKVRLSGVPFAADYWVLWVDQDYRTAVVGVPSGRAGWILNRTPSIPPDRLDAARRVLEFNGYDLSKLVMSPQELP